jgi:Zn-dependent protease with chaperone function
VGLAGGLSLLGAGLTLAVSGLGRGWAAGLAALPGQLPDVGAAGWAGLLLASATGLWLAAVTMTSAWRVAAARHAHRARLDLIAGSWPGSPGKDARARAGSARTRGPLAGMLRLVDYPIPVAYCLPGLRPRIVVSRGAVAGLSPEALAAVLAHEQAHARGRHDVLIQPFIAWRQAFPFLPTARQALRSVELLAEMLADDAACRASSTAALRTALQHIGDEHLTDTPNTRAIAHELAQRDARLAGPLSPLPLPAATAAYAAAAALLLLPPALLALA